MAGGLHIGALAHAKQTGQRLRCEPEPATKALTKPDIAWLLLTRCDATRCAELRCRQAAANRFASSARPSS
ncbi:hypothetical protein WK78_24040 [Burkholderia cepacia]|nr:hypothetical protein WK78_24040 [Burkholderia cepacia]